jgi:phage protein D
VGLKALPDFKLTIGSADVTARIRDRLMSMTLVDNSGEESDTLEIVLNDAGNVIESPRKGAVLNLSLGYVGDGLYAMGRFTVDEVEPSGPPDILTIRAKAADMRASLKAQHSRSFTATTIGAIVADIAGDHGLTPAVSAALASVAIAHRDQTNESDLHFLTRLGRDFDAVAAPKDGRLVFAPASTGLSASGKALDTIALTRADLTSWKGVSADRNNQGSVRARYRDNRAARTHYARAGSGDPVKTLRSTYRDQATAQAAADAELARSGRAANGIELTLSGRPILVAQTPIVTTGLRPELSGRWIARTVQHALDFESAGFVTTVTGTKAS